MKCAVLKCVCVPLAEEDYELTTRNFTFTPDNQDEPQCVDITIINDNNTEGSEVFNGELDTVEERVILEPQRTNITIVDNDCKFLL